MLTFFRNTDKRYTFDSAVLLKKYPPVAIVVAARHEPKSILEKTFSTLKALDYENKKIYLLDDSSEESFQKEADLLAKEFKIKIYRRAKRHGAKAGIINDFLNIAKEKYIVIFDADQNPVPTFLKKLIPILEKNDNLAFIQTPQFYTNINTSPVALGSTIQQAIFYENICEAKSSRNSMFCCGTNVIFRKDALLDVGGFDEKSITEDFATSIKFHMKKYESLYYNKVSAFGMAPENLIAYFKQQARWSAGTIDVFRKIIINFFKNPFQLKFIQWWEYFLSGSYYFLGWAFLFMILGPITFLTFGIPSVFGMPEIYLYPFVIYFVMSLYLFYTSMKERSYSINELYHGIILSFLNFPILLKSTISGLVGKRMTFVVTTKGKVENMPIITLWPYIILIVLNLIAIVSGIVRIKNNF